MLNGRAVFIADESDVFNKPLVETALRTAAMQEIHRQSRLPTRRRHVRDVHIIRNLRNLWSR
jgi:hypothetical protein